MDMRGWLYVYNGLGPYRNHSRRIGLLVVDYFQEIKERGRIHGISFIRHTKIIRARRYKDGLGSALRTYRDRYDRSDKPGRHA